MSTQPGPDQELQKALAELKKTAEEVSKKLDESIKALRQSIDQFALKPKQQQSRAK